MAESASYTAAQAPEDTAASDQPEIHDESITQENAREIPGDVTAAGNSEAPEQQ